MRFEVAGHGQSVAGDVDQSVLDLASHIPFKTSDDLPLGLALGGSPRVGEAAQMGEARRDPDPRYTRRAAAADQVPG
jgi:hypothetical protein